jgi:DNA-directed RNA polymerase sigma subunit (sigma70/sigma32)
MAKWKRLVPFSDFSRRELDRVLPLSREEDPPTLADQALLAEMVTRALQELRPKDRAVLVLRYGLLGSNCYTLDEMARILGYACEYVSACHHAGLRRLRNVLLRSRA